MMNKLTFAAHLNTDYVSHGPSVESVEARV